MINEHYIRWALVCLLVGSVADIQAQNDSTSITKRTHHLGEVIVMGGGARRVNNSAYNVMAIDTRQLRNSTLDLSGVLDRMAGVKTRQEGGLGSAINLNVGGFTGKHVKVFIDGMPMDNMASSFSLANIPIALASRLEVYKGVVPVSLGSDALGGAINIVTEHSPNTYVDASYSLGSWNTHKANVAAGWTVENGLMLRINAYRNSSDNNYKVKTQWTDLQTSAMSEEEGWFRRFHDKYHNEAVSLQAGLLDRPWADKLIAGLTLSHESADVQNANLMKIVFGGKHRKSTTVAPQLLYEKRNLFVPGLNLRMSARYDVTTTNNTDTLSRTYSWTGEWVPKSYKGEGVASLAEFRGKTLSTVASLRYTIAERHFLTLNDTYTGYSRTTTDDAANAAQQTAATYMSRTNRKNTLGFSYKYLPSHRGNAEAFAKYFHNTVKGPVNIATSGRAVYEEQELSTDAMGYGAAATYFFIPNHLQLKASYEKTYRLPTERELFGDGDYEQGQTTLRPESSNNLNLNLAWDTQLADVHSLHADLGVGYRAIADYIIRTIGAQGTAISSNHGKVRGWLMDANLRYYYLDRLQLGANYTLQSLRDRERHNAIGAESVTYGNRVPNQPYAFGNFDLSYTFPRLFGPTDRLQLTWNTRYVHRFFRTWMGYGAQLYIPEQLSHDIGAVYSMKSGRYNISLEMTNLTDATLYDNYSLQRPGRGMSVKFRYMFYKRH